MCRSWATFQSTVNIFSYAFTFSHFLWIIAPQASRLCCYLLARGAEFDTSDCACYSGGDLRNGVSSFLSVSTTVLKMIAAR